MDHRATLRAVAGFLIAASAVVSIYLAVTAGKMATETGVHLDTSVSIVAFLLVFLIYRDERKDNKALHAKIDALIKASEADDEYRGLEEKGETEVFRKGSDPS